MSLVNRVLTFACRRKKFIDLTLTKKDRMTYRLNGNSLLFAINRTDIPDISVNDTISVEGFPGVDYVWTAHDMEFVENNPDDDIFLQVERTGSSQFKGKEIVLKPRD